MINAMSCTGGVYISHCSFSDWPDDFNRKAFYGTASNPVEIRFSWFGEASTKGFIPSRHPFWWNTTPSRTGTDIATRWM